MYLIWGAKPKFYRQDRNVLKADRYVFNVPRYGMEHEIGQFYHKILKSDGVLELFLAVTSLTFLIPLSSVQLWTQILASYLDQRTKWFRVFLAPNS